MLLLNGAVVSNWFSVLVPKRWQRMRGIARIACEIERFSVALHLPVERAPPAGIGRPGGLAGARGSSLLTNIFTLVQALLNYILSLTGGVLPIGL